jgi:hypothetical protein
MLTPTDRLRSPRYVDGDQWPVPSLRLPSTTGRVSKAHLWIEEWDMRAIGTILIASILVACAGKTDVIRPTAQPSPASNIKIVDRPRSAVWDSSVPELGKQFFVINNLDRASGLINVSYNGDPEKYVDCGRVTSYVKNLAGERTYNFPGSKAAQQYETMTNGQLVFFDRRMSLEGRINLVFEETSPTQTKVTANTRYVLQRNITAKVPGENLSQSASDSISFSSVKGESFPPNNQGLVLECVPNGELERQLLEAIR